MSANMFFPQTTKINFPVKKSDIPAQWAYERLQEYIYDFEKGLDADHEIGARLVSFGQTLTFHIIDMSYWGPDIITFDGELENGEKVKLIQHVSQLSVLLMAGKKLHAQPKRIGFRWEEEILSRRDEKDKE